MEFFGAQTAPNNAGAGSSDVEVLGPQRPRIKRARLRFGVFGISAPKSEGAGLTPIRKHFLKTKLKSEDSHEDGATQVPLPRDCLRF